jgi:hypothetical protein
MVEMRVQLLRMAQTIPTHQVAGISKHHIHRAEVDPQVAARRLVGRALVGERLGDGVSRYRPGARRRHRR